MDATTPTGTPPGPADLLASGPTVLHLGALHPAEQALVYLLAFGPFVVLALVVVVRRRQDRRAEERAAAVAPQAPQRDR